MKIKSLVIIGFSLMSICMSRGALIVNGDMSANSYAPSSDNNHAEFQAVGQGWAVKSQGALDFDTNFGKITWDGPDKNLLTDGLVQINAVSNETGNILTLSFDWTAASGASSTNVSLEYQVVAWTTNTSPAANDVMMKNINGETKKVAAVGGGTVYDLLNDGAESTGSPTFSFGTFDGIAGSNMTASIPIELSNDVVTDISGYDFIGVRFHIAGDNSDLTAIGSTLDNVQLAASNGSLADDDESNFYTDYIGLVSSTVDLVADYGFAWDPVNGADGSDTNEDSFALQAAIDAMTALPNGGKITIPAGTFYLKGLILKSNVHLEIDSGATLVAASEGIMFKMGLGRKGVEALTTVSNTSIRGVGGRFTVDGSWIDSSNKFSFVICNNVDNFMISDFYMIDNYTVFSAIMTSMAAHDGQYFVARNGVMKNCHMINAHFGYGMVQAWAGHNMLFKDLSGVGGVTLRCETGLNSLMTAPNYINLDNAYGRNITVTNGHAGVMLGAHGRPNGHVDVDGVIAVSSLYAVSVGDGFGHSAEDITQENYGFSPSSIIRNVHAVYGTNAQLKSKNFSSVPCPIKHLISPTPFPHQDQVIYPGPSAYVAKTLDPEIEIINVTAEGFQYVSHLVYGDVPYRTLTSCPAVSVTNLSVSPASVSLQTTQTAQLIETVFPAHASQQGVNWMTDDPSVAIVDANGEITAVGAGSCTITCLTVDWGWPATCEVTVSGGGGGSWSELSSNDFELGWGDWVSGGTDAFLSTNNAIGTQCVDLQDNTSTSHMQLSGSLDLMGYSHLKIDCSVISTKFGSTHEFLVEFSDNGSSSWTPAKACLYDYEFDNDDRQEMSLVLDNGNFNFTSNVTIRLRCNAAVDNDDIYVDNVIISAFAPSGWGNFVSTYDLSGVAAYDSDGDGESDLYEYGLGGNPTNPGVQGTACSMVYGPGDAVSYLNQEVNLTNSGITYLPEWSTSLVSGTWTSLWDSATITPSGDPGYNQVERHIDAGTNDSLFFRMKVSQP